MYHDVYKFKRQVVTNLKFFLKIIHYDGTSAQRVTHTKQTTGLKPLQVLLIGIPNQKNSTEPHHAKTHLNGRTSPFWNDTDYGFVICSLRRLYFIVGVIPKRKICQGPPSLVDDYRKGFKNNFFVTSCIRSDLLDLYAGWGVYLRPCKTRISEGLQRVAKRFVKLPYQPD